MFVNLHSVLGDREICSSNYWGWGHRGEVGVGAVGFGALQGALVAAWPRGDGTKPLAEKCNDIFVKSLI